MKVIVITLIVLVLGGSIWWNTNGGLEGFLDRQHKKGMDESGEEKARQADVVGAHKTSIRNKESIMKSSECGCFHCLAIFPPSRIKEWTDTSEPELRHTALCPECGIDSVIGSDSGYSINKDFLSAMQKHWF